MKAERVSDTNRGIHLMESGSVASQAVCPLMFFPVPPQVQMVVFTRSVCNKTCILIYTDRCFCHSSEIGVSRLNLDPRVFFGQ